MPVLRANQQSNPIASAGGAGSGLASGQPWVKRKDWSDGLMRDSVGLHLDVFVIGFMGLAFVGAAFVFYRQAAGVKPASPIPGNETQEMLEMVLGFAKETGIPGADQALQANTAVERLKHRMDPNHDPGQGPAGSPPGALPLPMMMFKSKPTNPVVKFVAAVAGMVGIAWFLAGALYPNFAALLSHFRH